VIADRIWYYVLSVAVALVNGLLPPHFVVEELVVGVGEVDSCSLDALTETDVVEALGLLVAVSKGTEKAFVNCSFVVVNDFGAILFHEYYIEY
jgi:hypothetical protein